MEIIIKDVEGKRIKCNARVVEIVGKDSDHYRIQQDIQRGIEVTGEGLSSKLYIEPRCANQITIINKVKYIKYLKLQICMRAKRLQRYKKNII